MSDVCIPLNAITELSPLPTSAAATHDERQARTLLSRRTPRDTAEAMCLLRNTEDRARGAEWYFLMGICDLHRGYVVDAQAHLDQACRLSREDAAHEYRTLYASVRNAYQRKHGEEGIGGGRECLSGADCLDCCDCVDCCDCDGSGSCCDCDGCCDCGDGCN